MPHRTKVWIATVTYSSELGNLDVDFGVDDLADLHTVISNGPGYGVVDSIEVERNPKVAVKVITIEQYAREATKHAAHDDQPSRQPAQPDRDEEMG